MGEIEAGIRELEVAVRLAPDSAETHFTLARAYAKAGRDEDAARERAAFARAGAARPDRPGQPPQSRARPAVKAARAALALLAACLGAALRPAGRPGPAPRRPVLVDVTEKAGLRWSPGVARGDWNLVETQGGGGGFVDYDGDGWLDVYLVSYSLEPDPRTGRPAGDALFRNNHDGTFTDVTERAGIRGLRRGMGLAVADYDGDGRPDLFVSAYGASVLYHNEGDGTFRDVTDRGRRARAGCGAAAPPSSTTTATAGPTSSSRTTWTTTRRRASDYPCEHDRRVSLLLDREVPGPAEHALPQPRRRHVRGRERRGRASPASSARAWASWPPTSTTTAGSTSSRRTTRRRTSSSGTWATAASATWPSRPRWPSTPRAGRRGPWAPTPRTWTATVAWTCW